MNEMASSNEGAELPCNTIVFRALLRKDWIDPDDQDAILPAAYIPRPDGRDDEGLSVEVASFRSYGTLEEGAALLASRFNKPKGIATLHTGRVRDLNISSEKTIDIVADPILPDQQDHALIVGLSSTKERSIIEIERIAGNLARMSRIIKNN